MNIHVSKPGFIKNSLRISGAIVLVLGASLIIPKIADAAGTLNHMVHNNSTSEPRNNADEYEANLQDSLNEYEPPDFGRPLSAYGSGTRWYKLFLAPWWVLYFGAKAKSLRHGSFVFARYMKSPIYYVFLRMFGRPREVLKIEYLYPHTLHQLG